MAPPEAGGSDGIENAENWGGIAKLAFLSELAVQAPHLGSDVRFRGILPQQE